MEVVEQAGGEANRSSRSRNRGNARLRTEEEALTSKIVSITIEVIIMYFLHKEFL